MRKYNHIFFNCVIFQDQYKDVKTILQKTLFLLKLLLRENHKVQSIIFEKLDTLLDVKGVESDLALALQEVSVLIHVLCKGLILTCEMIMRKLLSVLIKRKQFLKIDPG